MIQKKTICTVLTVVLLLVTLFNNTSTASSVTSSSPIIINEVMADNTSTIQCDVGNYSDWIELYNTANYDVDISGMFLTDNLTTYMWQFPNGTIITTHGYLLVWADGNIRIGDLHANFKLSADGETIGLFATDGSLVDSVTFGKQAQDVAYGRTTDGGSNWSYMINPTPGQANYSDTSLFTGYSVAVWGILAAALSAVGLLIFKDKITRRHK